MLPILPAVRPAGNGAVIVVMQAGSFFWEEVTPWFEERLAPRLERVRRVCPAP